MSATARCQVAIVGGGLAGAACAIELRRSGVDAVAFERERFPRPKVCGEFLSPGAVACLAALDVLDEVREAGAVAIEGVRLRCRDREVEVPFERPGLGFSRLELDRRLAGRAGVVEGATVRSVEPGRGGFHLEVESREAGVSGLYCDAVIDAAGRASRFTRRRPSGQFGVQFKAAGSLGGTLEFRFFEGGYGGSVSVEGGRTNTCYLVDARHIGRYRDVTGALVTGSIAYRRLPGPYLAIGDASGMVDPFSGEGMRHALASGLLAARIVADGTRAGASYSSLCERYERAWRAQWRSRRRLSRALRWLLSHPPPLGVAFAAGSRFPGLVGSCLHRLWK